MDGENSQPSEQVSSPTLRRPSISSSSLLPRHREPASVVSLTALDLFTHVSPSLGHKLLLRGKAMFYFVTTDAKVPENAENLEPREFYIHLLFFFF